jgi:hypothetical protein
VYAPRTRFIPAALSPLFERQAHGGAAMPAGLDAPPPPGVDVGARLRAMWR